MRALRPGCLPSDTAIRFLLVLAAVTSASLYMFQSLWFTARGQQFAAVILQCAEQLGDLRGGAVGTVTAQLQAEAQCRSGLSREQAAFAGAGSALILVVGWVGYRLLPRWRIRRRQLAPPDPEDGQALVSEVAGLADVAGVHPVPGIRLDVSNPAVSGFAFGAGRDLQLGVTGGLVVAQALDPPGFAAVIRHELGHVANRDVPWTYYATSVWWAFTSLAVLPVVVIFAFRDISYLLRLGWRTAVLAGLVALTIAALLRAREVYADDRAAAWGSAAALDRLLAAQPATHQRWPRPLRTHPPARERRGLLSDPDGLFTASGWAAAAAGISAGTAQASLADLLYLVTPRWAVPAAALLVAPLLATVVCTAAWRIALREMVRGAARPLVARVGLGLGAGLAVSPLLTINAAVGAGSLDRSGQQGLVVWALGMIVLSWIVVRWVGAVARLRVATALAEPVAPRRALIAQIAVVSAVITIWLATAHYAHLFLTALGPIALGFADLWRFLPASAVGSGLGLAPLAAFLLFAALPIAARRHGDPASRPAAWLWRDGQPTRPGDVAAGAPDAPSWRVPLLIGALAGGAAGLAPLAVMLIGQRLPAAVRESEHFGVLIGQSVSTAHLVAASCAAAAAAVTLPRGWWPLSLATAAIAGVAVALMAWVSLTAYRYGLLDPSVTGHRPPGWQLTYQLTAAPAGLAMLVSFLVAAVVSGLRELLSGVFGRRGDQPAQRAGASRALPCAAGAGLAAGLLMAPTLLDATALQVPAVGTAAFQVSLPAEWQGKADPATGNGYFVTIAQDVQVTILPVASLLPTTGEGEITVGGATMSQVGTLDQAGVRFVGYEAQTPAGLFRVVVAGTPGALADRQEEVRRLFAAVHWLSDSAAG